MRRDEVRRRPAAGAAGGIHWIAAIHKYRWLLLGLAALIGGWLVLRLLLSFIGVLNQYLNVPLCLLAGAAGYLAASFWLDPARRALDLLHQATAAALYEANLIENQRGGRRLEERQEACRRLAAELAAADARMPAVCRAWLRRGGQDPRGASRGLFLLAASQDDDEAWIHLQGIFRCLGVRTAGEPEEREARKKK